MNDKFDEFVETKLGRFTSDWSMVKFGDIYPSLTTGSTPSRSKPEYFQGEILWVTSGELKYNVICDTWEKLTVQAVRDTNLRLYPPGTFFIAITGLEAAGTRGSCAIIGKEATTNQSCMAFVANDRIDTNFLFQFYRCFGEAVAFTYSQGTKQQSLNGNIVRSIEIPLPPLPEQRKIARILTTVDNLIEKTEALIAKYQAIKQGMMHDLFTRGVDEHGHLRPPYEDAPKLYKQSGLGWIPKEWRETTVGHELLGIDAGKSPDCPDIPAPLGEWGVLKVSAVQPDGFRSTENKVVLNPVWVNPAYEVKDGDLLISRSNTYQLVGLVCHVHSPQPRLMLCDKTLRLRFNPREAAASFMFWLFQQPVVRRHIEVHATGTSGSMKNISQPVIRSARIMLPPVEEQERITDRIEAIQDNIAAQRRTQEKLMIEKTGLMQDLLTGTVRVKVE